MAIGSPDLKPEQRKEAEENGKHPIAKTQLQSEHIGVKPQKGAKKKE